MELTQQRVAAWKYLESQLRLVQDPVLRNSMMAEFKKRALEDWGFFPKTGQVAKKTPVVLDDWEKELVADIEKHLQYEVDTRKDKREKEARLAKANMRIFIEKGGSFSILPKELQTEHIHKLYIETLLEETQNCLDLLKK